MDLLKNTIAYLTKKNHFSTYLSLFRVFLSLHLIKKVYLLWGSQSILLSEGVFFEHKEIFIDYFGIDSSLILNNASIFLSIIVITAILLLFGIGRNLTLILVYFELKILQELTYPILNGGDNLMIFVVLYLIFSNCFEKYTLNKNSRDHSPMSNLISNVAVYSICIHLGYVYFISAVHKIHADVWFNGTAIYYILNLERYGSPLAQYIRDNGFITTMGTYFTVLFELLFVFLVWNRRLRPFFLVSGVILHMGIYLFMMIYDFQIFFLSLYGFFIPEKTWKAVFSKMQGIFINLKLKVA